MNILKWARRWGALCLLAILPLQAFALGNTPSSQVVYKFDPSVTGLNSVDFGITIEAEPGARSNVYWSNQFQLIGTGTAYTGMQNNAETGDLFLFSVWNGLAGKVGTAGSWCETTHEDGTGWGCRIKRDWKAGHTYQFHVAHEGSGWIGVTVNDLTDGSSFKIGSVRTSSTQISPQGMINWVEYFEWNWSDATCYNQPFTNTEFLLPIGNGGTTVASTASTSTNTSCASRVDQTAVGTVHLNAIGNSYRGVVKQTRDLCVDAHTYKSGDPATGYYCHGKDNQSWVLGADKTLRTRNNLCLDAYNYGTTPGTKVNVYTCHGAANQQWKLVGSELVGVQSGLCLNATQAGEQLTLQHCDQGWSIPMP